jgi:hypothetical protein
LKLKDKTKFGIVTLGDVARIAIVGGWHEKAATTPDRRELLAGVGGRNKDTSAFPDRRKLKHRRLVAKYIDVGGDRRCQHHNTARNQKPFEFWIQI